MTSTPSPSEAAGPAGAAGNPPGPRPKIAVFGAGSIGCHLGGHLSAVADVTLVGRQAAMDTVSKDGLTLTETDSADVRVAPDALRTATGPEAVEGADYVLVTVKSAATTAAAEAIRPHLGPGTVVVSFQNGLRNPDLLRTALPGRTVLAGMVPYNVVQAGPGAFHQGLGGALMLDGSGPGGPGEPLVRAMEAAGLHVEPRDDMREVQHGKLLLNLNNALNALSGLPLRDELGQRPYRECLALCQEEALAAFGAAGVEAAPLSGAAPEFVVQVLRLEDDDYRQLAAETLRIDAKARSSMWEDLQRGRATEIDTLQGEVVALAGQYGLRAPANARLVELVRDAEAAGPESVPAWSGPGLLAELTAAVRAAGPTD